MIEANVREGARGRITVLGLLVTALVVAGLLLSAKPAHADATFVVNTRADFPDADNGDGVCADASVFQACTLRAAIQEANSTTGANTINFDIASGSGTALISPTSPLPTIREAVTVDGYSQSGASPNTLTNGSTNAVLKIVVSGASAPAGSNGLSLDAGAGGTTIRGLVINGFKKATTGGNGIFLNSGANNTNNKIEGNFIGTNAGGTADVGNQAIGIDIRDQSTGNTIGGTQADKRNLISGNDEWGVRPSDGNLVRNNLIGTDKTGENDLGNTVGGIVVLFSSNNNLVKDNRVAFNGGAGILVDGNPFGTGNAILSNSVFSNEGLGIDLDDDSVAQNDPGDADLGPNNLQNFPVLFFAVTSSATTIAGTLNSTPNQTFDLQFFSNPAGGNEGKTFLGEKSVTTNSKGGVSFFFSDLARASAGDSLTATATSASGDTSEFSKAVTAQQRSFPPPK